MSDLEIRVEVLRKMLRHRWIGGKHTSLDNLPKGFPQHVRSDVSRVVKDLIRDGFIILKPTSYGQEVSLAPSKVFEAKKLTGMS